MNILLVNPPYDIKRYMGGLGKVGWVFPPVGLLYIASYIRENNPAYNIKVYDSQVDENNFHEFLDEFKPEIVGITCQSAASGFVSGGKAMSKISPPFLPSPISAWTRS